MSPFWQNLELLPSSTREKARRVPRSPEEYAEGRKKVKEGVREAAEQREKNEHLAEVMLYIEMNEEKLKEKMKEENLADVLADFGSYDRRQWHQMMQAFAQTHFDLSVNANEDGQPNVSMTIDLPEGNVAEKLQLNQSLQDALVARALGKSGSSMQRNAA